MVTETPAFSKLVLHSSTMPVPLRPEVTKSTCLTPIAAASGPACSYAPGPNSDLGCLKNSLTGNSNIREVSMKWPPLLSLRQYLNNDWTYNHASTASCLRHPVDQPLSLESQ